MIIIAATVGVASAFLLVRDDRRRDESIVNTAVTRAVRTPRLSGSGSSAWEARHLLSRGGTAAERPHVITPPGSPPFVADQLVITFRGGTSTTQRRAARAALGVRVVRPLPLPRTELVSTTTTAAVESVRAAASQHPAVEYAEPNFVYEAAGTVPDDPWFTQLWGLDNRGQAIFGRSGVPDADIDATEAWDLTTGSTTVAIGVTDTGIDHTHEDLAANIWSNPGEIGGGKETNGRDDDNNGYVDDWRGWDWIDDDNDPADLHGHGTHVAGTIGARGSDGLGITGLNWRARLVPLRVLDADGSGTTADIAAAFAYAGAEGINVVNASLGGPGFSQLLSDTIAGYPKTLYVVAAGNAATNNETNPIYPCNYTAPNLICVAASTNTDELSSFSNYGATSVDLAAPGSGILSTIPTFVEPLKETFDIDLSGRWTTGGTGSSWGRVQDASGFFLGDTPDGGSTGPSDSYVATAAPLDLRGLTGCRVRYDLRLELARTDALRVQASRDGSAWEEIGNWSGSTSASWIQMNDDLSRFDNAATVSVRFRVTTAAASELAGADLDNIRIRCLAAGGSTSYSYYSGTSMASPHVAGAVGLLWAAVPDASAATVRSVLFSGSDPKPSLIGKVAKGARLNVRGSLDALAVTDPPAASPPPPIERAPATVSPTETAGPVPSPSPSPSGEIDRPDPTASPTPSPTHPAVTEHRRSVSLRFRDNFVARGRVVASDGTVACARGIPVKILRNGRRVGKTITDAAGSYRIRLPTRSGRYIAVAQRVTVGAKSCLAASSHKRPGIRFRASASDEVTAASELEACATSEIAERTLVAALNDERQRRDLPPLIVDAEVSRLARDHTADMAEAKVVFHRTPDALRQDLAVWNVIANNVAVGSTVETLRLALMNSAEHRESILDNAYTHVGVGTLQRDGKLWLTLILVGGGAEAAAPERSCLHADEGQANGAAMFYSASSNKA